MRALPSPSVAVTPDMVFPNRDRVRHAILATLEVIFVLAVVGALHLVMFVHEFTLKRDHRAVARKAIRTVRAPS